MSGNRFDFLELGDGAGRPSSESLEEAEQPPQPFTPARDIVAERGPHGEPLAQVWETSSRGYLNYETAEQTPFEPQRILRPTDLRDGAWRVTETFGQRGTEPGQFQFPGGISLDSHGSLFIADTLNHRIQRVSADGGVAVLESKGAGRSQFLSPMGTATDAEGSFFVVEQGGHRFQKSGPDGSFQWASGRLGSREGELRSPTAIAVGPSSQAIYIADSGNGRVQRFSPDGRHIFTFPTPDLRGAGYFNPQALAVDREENAYVADPFSGATWLFQSRGEMHHRIKATFRYPRALACGESGVLYAADAGDDADFNPGSGGRISVFYGPKSHEIGQISAAVGSLGRMSRPSGLAVGAGDALGRPGSLYVSDTLNHRILRFDWRPL